MRIEEVSETILHLCPHINRVSMHFTEEFYLLECEDIAGQVSRVGIYYKLSYDDEALHQFVMQAVESINEGRLNAD